MNINNLATKKNLLLAWRRITASSDARYKNFFRPMLEAYELSVDKNILDLARRLKHGEYTPKSPVRIYMPKPSGLQRPITLLHLEDQIVLQALTNLFAEKIRSQRVPIEYKNVFSNKLGKKDSDFFLQNWRRGYTLQKRVIKSKFSRGYVWVVKFDLSSFYDTIPHDLLLKILAPRQNSALYVTALEWMSVWSSGGKKTQHRHGIPQGPMASSFLAEAILLAIDEEMIKKYEYFRYVDDIHLLGKTEIEARRALVHLDVLCKDIGLIPNTSKTKIKLVQTSQELVNDLPDITSYPDRGEVFSIKGLNADAQIDNAVELSETFSVTDKTLFRYILFRAPASKKILDIILMVWEHYPEHTDAYIVFLENYKTDKSVIDLATHLLLIDFPYDYVLGELWKLIVKMGSPNDFKKLINKALEVVKNPLSGNAAGIGSQIFLCKCDMVGLGNYQKWLMYEKRSLTQALVAPYLNLNANSGIEAGKQYLSRSSIDSYLALIKPMIISSIKLSSFKKDVTKFPLAAQHVFKAAGLSKHTVPSADAINNLLTKRYTITKWNKWKKLLQGEYTHAHKELRFSDTYFDTHLTPWLSYLDAFNEIVFREFQKFLKTKQATGAVSLNTKKGILQDYGNMLSRQQAFKIAYPNLQNSLLKIHRRRNRLPSSHPYDKVTGKKTLPLKKPEQRKMMPYFENALNEIIDIIEDLGI